MKIKGKKVKVHHKIDTLTKDAAKALTKTQGIYYIVRKDAPNKDYVGSSLDMGNRLRQHQNHKRLRIQRAIQKHGAHKFEVLILEVTYDLTSEQLEELETHYFRLLDPYYNDTEPGVLGPKYIKYNISIWDRQNKLVAVLGSLTAAAQFLGVNISTLRTRLRDGEGINNQYWATTDDKPPTTLQVVGNPVKICDAKGQVLNRCPSPSAAGEWLGIDRTTALKYYKSGLLLYDFVRILPDTDFQTVDAQATSAEVLKLIGEFKELAKRPKDKMVIAYNIMTGRTIQVFPSLTAAGEFYGLTKGTVWGHIKKGTKTQGFIGFKYKEKK